MTGTKMRGKAWVFGDILDVDWEICPNKMMIHFMHLGIAPDPEILGTYCMVNVDPDFPKKVQKGDFIVAGENMGYGHDHDHACLSIIGAGVAAVLCDSTNSNFLRNSINHGLPVIEYPGIREATREGDEMEVDLVAGTIKNLTKGEEYHFTPYPAEMLEIIQVGDIYDRLKQEIEAGRV